MAGIGGVMGGIPIRVDPSFLLLTVFMGLLGGRGLEGAAIWVVVVGVSILVHELGHALTFRAFGVSSSVLLYAMGGLTVPEQGPRLRPGQDILVSLAGPGIGLVFGAVVYVFAPPGDFAPDSLARLASLYLLYVNVAWGLVNLLPILPLDGGNVLAAILQKTMGAKGVRAVRIVSLIAAFALGALGLAYKQPFVAILAFYFGSMNLAALRGDNEARPSPEQEVLVKGVTALEAGNTDGAEWAARNVLDRPEASTELKAVAAELLTWTGLAKDSLPTATAGLAAGPVGPLARACVELVRRGRPAAPELATALAEGSPIIPARIVARSVLGWNLADELVDQLGDMPDRARAEAGLARLQEILHRAGNFAEAAGVGQRAFALTDGGVIAFNTACSLARAGRHDDAVTWLGRAIDAGWLDEAQLERDPDLDPIRSRPEIAAIRARLAGAPGSRAGTTEAGE